MLRLAGGAAWGLKAQERAARVEALEWAQREAEAVLAALEARWISEARQNWVRLYNVLPPPAEPAQVSPLYDALGRQGREQTETENEIAETQAQETILREAATGASAFGLTPAGLPLGPLAALAHLEEALGAERARRLAVLALHFAPSSVSPLIFGADGRGDARRAAVREQGHAGARWGSDLAISLGARARGMSAMPEPFHSSAGYWVLPFPDSPTSFLSLQREGETREVPASGDVFGVLSAAEAKIVAEVVRQEWKSRLPGWAELMVSWDDEKVGRAPSSHDLVAEASHPAWKITATMVERSPGALLVGHRQWTQWAWSLVGAAVASAAVGSTLAWRLLVQESVQLMQSLAEARNLMLTPQLPSSSFTPSVDATAIQQALINLLDNAIKYSPPGGQVVITLSNAGDGPVSSSPVTWCLSVRDDGPGIPVAEHGRIFERFYRLGNELRRETQGAGIGLSLVKHITEGHGGRVEVISAPGKGCEMRLVFKSHHHSPTTP